MVCRIAYSGSVESARKDLGLYHMTRRFAKRAYATDRYRAYRRGVGENLRTATLARLDSVGSLATSDAANLGQKVCH
jgi:hypothetical protein